MGRQECGSDIIKQNRRRIEMRNYSIVFLNMNERMEFDELSMHDARYGIHNDNEPLVLDGRYYIPVDGSLGGL
jgi:hypothetical protein